MPIIDPKKAQPPRSPGIFKEEKIFFFHSRLTRAQVRSHRPQTQTKAGVAGPAEAEKKKFFFF